MIELCWVLICTVHLTVCSCHVTNAFQSESTLYSSLNVKELFAQNRREIGIIECGFTLKRIHDMTRTYSIAQHFEILHCWFKYKGFLYKLTNSDNTKSHPLQVKINCFKFIINRLKQQCHMTFLIPLFVTLRKLLFGVLLLWKKQL